jgi:transposase
MTSTIHDEHAAPGLVMALELGRGEWKLGFGTGIGRSMRRRTLRADSWRQIANEIAAAKAHFGVSAEAPVISCYEAGLDGFWVHRYLTSQGVTNLVVDSSSIEVNRRARRAKTDRLDVERLLLLLLRYVGGERSALRVVHVPSELNEQGQQLHRELLALKRDRTRVTNRITGLLATQGVHVSVRANFGVRLEQLTLWNGQPLPTALHTRLVREWQKVELCTTQIRELERARRDALRQSNDHAVRLVRRLRELRGIGDHAAWLFVMELFAWRQVRTPRQVAAITGLAPRPYRSGSLDWEQGISKAGNRAVRAIAIQIAWMWLLHQPDSALAKWYEARFAHGGQRARKIGIVAVARRLMIDLWRYVEAGVIPEGAQLKVAEPASLVG